MPGNPSTIPSAVAKPAAMREFSPAKKGNRFSRLESGFDEHSDLIAAFAVVSGFVWRLWLAHATFFNTDEAWHFFLANQGSAGQAYKASLTISHPPLLILILYFWRVLGTSELVLRLPAVLAGTIFCWIFYKWLELVAGRATAWAGLILAAFLAPMIATSADVRQNPLLLMFAAGTIYFFDRALADDSAPEMAGSSVCLYLAMLSHYSAFFVAGALGVYAIVRMLWQRPSSRVMLIWVAGQVGGVALAGLLYKTHLGRLGSILNQALLPQQYLSTSYFHKGTDHLLPYLYRGTFGIFRFFVGQTQIGQVAAILFVAGLIFLFASRDSESDSRKPRALGILLLLPFVLNWLAAAEGLYPYGRMRQCMFLGIFGLAGMSICLARIANKRALVAAMLAVGIVVPSHVFGTPQDRDAIPLAEQRREHMDQALHFIRTEVSPNDVIFTDQATSYQLRHYLCDQKPVSIEVSRGLESFRCEAFHIVFTGPNDGALTAQSLDTRWHDSDRRPDLNSTAEHVWVVQGGWASGLGEELQHVPGFTQIEVHPFGRYLEIFRLPTRLPRLAQG